MTSAGRRSSIQETYGGRSQPAKVHVLTQMQLETVVSTLVSQLAGPPLQDSDLVVEGDEDVLVQCIQVSNRNIVLAAAELLDVDEVSVPGGHLLFQPGSP